MGALGENDNTDAPINNQQRNFKPSQPSPLIRNAHLLDVMNTKIVFFIYFVDEFFSDEWGTCGDSKNTMHYNLNTCAMVDVGRIFHNPRINSGLSYAYFKSSGAPFFPWKPLLGVQSLFVFSDRV